MNAIATGITAALVSGLVMYTAGAKAAQLDAFTDNPALVQTVGGQSMSAAGGTALRPVATPPATVTPVSNNNATRRRTVNRTTTAARADDEIIGREEIREDDRSWSKTAMVIGGSAASGAGVGGIVGGKKGAMIGAAIGGGAASIYEATQRR
jgi:hypothetical protein